MLEGLPWNPRKWSFGKGEIFQPPPEPPKTQPFMERKGPPRKTRTALAYFDDDLPDKRALRALFKRSYLKVNQQTLAQKIAEKLTEPVRLLSDIRQNRIIF